MSSCKIKQDKYNLDLDILILLLDFEPLSKILRNVKTM